MSVTGYSLSDALIFRSSTRPPGACPLIMQVDLVLDVTSIVSHTGSTPIYLLGWWQVRRFLVIFVARTQQSILPASSPQQGTVFLVAREWRSVVLLKQALQTSVDTQSASLSLQMSFQASPTCSRNTNFSVWIGR